MTVPAAIAFAAIGAYVAFLLAHPGSASHFRAGDNIGETCIELLAFLIALPLGIPRHHDRTDGTRFRITVRDRAQLAPLLLALGILSYTIGQATWTVYEDLWGILDPFPSWADAGYLGTYPFLLAGMLLLPRPRVARAMRMRVVLDSVMIVTSAVTLTWYFLLGPTLMQGGDSLAARIVGAIYPLASPVLILCLLLLASHTDDGGLGRATVPLTIGLVLLTTTDAIFGYQELHSVYETGRVLDAGWPLAFLLVALGIRAVRLRLANGTPAPGYDAAPLVEQPRKLAETALWLWLLPYTLLAAVLLLIVSLQWVQRDPTLERGVYAGGAVLVLLGLARQVLARSEMLHLHRQVDAQHRELHAAYAEMRTMAMRDALTGLPSHRALVAALDTRFAAAQREARPFALLFVDVDHFKAINDAHGHRVGDAALRAFGTLLDRELREAEAVGRWGGEEFVCLLPGINEGMAMQIAERTRAAIERHRLPLEGAEHLTCSIGVATYPADGVTSEALLAAADNAMYEAKHLGRNRVCAASRVPERLPS
jgi:two-component system cell cycle response regulator